MAENKWVTGVKTLLIMGVMDGYGTNMLLMVQKSKQPGMVLKPWNS